MLELINRARANPAAEAARSGIDLNEGLAASSISTAAKQPLAMNDKLTYAIRSHVIWLRVNSKFQHNGQNNSTPQSRVTDAGYSLTGTSGSAENLGLTLGSTLGDLKKRVDTLFKNLFVDNTVAGRGHRLNLLNASMKETGVGVTSGDYTYNGQQWTAIIAGQDLAYHAGNSFLTGVVYEDKIAPDQFYSPGEGLVNYTITAINSAGGRYTGTSTATGGYNIQLPAGTYTVTAQGPNDSLVAKYSNVVVGTSNVKRDFEKAQFSDANLAPPPPVASVDSKRRLFVSGTKRRDSISVLSGAAFITVQVNEQVMTFDASAVDGIDIDSGDSNDYVLVGEDVPGGATITGGSGDDTLIGTGSADSIDGGDGNDLIKAGGGDDVVTAGLGNDNVLGEGGRDSVHGDDGNDRIDGGGGNDSLYGDTNDDRVYGGDGNDRLDGGGNVDKIYGEDGNDALIGGGSNDRLYGGIGNDVFWGNKGRDYIDGGAGTNVVRDREDIDDVLNGD